MYKIAVAMLLSITPAAAFAQSTPAPTPSAAPAPQAGHHYTTADTDLGTILDDPAAKAIVEKAIPGMTTNEQVEMARGMTLKAIQQFVPDQVTDQKLAQIDAEFAKLPAKK